MSRERNKSDRERDTGRSPLYVESEEQSKRTNKTETDSKVQRTDRWLTNGAGGWALGKQAKALRSATGSYATATCWEAQNEEYYINKHLITSYPTETNTK